MRSVAVRTSPESGSSRPAMCLSVTDLPVPDGPSTAKISPFRTANDSPSSTVLSPNRFVTLSNSMTVSKTPAPYSQNSLVIM